MSVYEWWIKVNKKNGFTLVEIMIVVAIIGVLVAVAVPALMRARLNANENVAKSNIRLLRDAIESYRMIRSPQTYPSLLNDLSNDQPPYVDSTLFTATAAPGRNGYHYEYTFVDDTQFTLYARPDSAGITGNAVYYVDEGSIIKANDASGPAIQ